MIRALIFDLGNVIVPFEFNRAYTRMEALTGLNPSQIRARIGTTDLVTRLETGTIPPQEFVSQLSELLKISLSFEEFGELWSSIFLPDPLIPESLLEALHTRYRLILLSNTNAIHFEMIRRSYPLLRHFDHFVLSHEVGALKPSPKIYQEAVRLAGCLPEECFFTDDIADFVAAACREGIDAVQFQGLEPLCVELRSRKIIE